MRCSARTRLGLRRPAKRAPAAGLLSSLRRYPDRLAPMPPASANHPAGTGGLSPDGATPLRRAAARATSRPTDTATGHSPAPNGPAAPESVRPHHIPGFSEALPPACPERAALPDERPGLSATPRQPECGVPAVAPPPPAIREDPPTRVVTQGGQSSPQPAC